MAGYHSVTALGSTTSVYTAPRPQALPPVHTVPPPVPTAPTAPRTQIPSPPIPTPTLGQSLTIRRDPPILHSDLRK